MESSSSAVLGGAAAPRASGQARTLGPVASARPPEVGPRNLASALLRRDAPPRQRPGPLLSLCCSRRLQRSQADGVAPWRSLLRLTRAQRKGGRNGRGVVRHSPVEPIHPPIIIHSRARLARPPARVSLGRARSVRGGGSGPRRHTRACRVAWRVLGRNGRRHGMTLAGPAPTTTKRDGAPFVSNAAAPSGLSPAPAELITGLFLRGRAASACSARDHCARRVGAQRVAP